MTKPTKPWAQEVQARKTRRAHEHELGLEYKVAKLFLAPQQLNLWRKSYLSDGMRSRAVTMGQLWDGVTPQEVIDTLQTMLRRAGVTDARVTEPETVRATTRLVRAEIPDTQLKEHFKDLAAVFDEVMQRTATQTLGGRA